MINLAVKKRAGQGRKGMEEGNVGLGNGEAESWGGAL